MSAEPTPIKDEQLVLSCEIPETASPGSTFHVQLENRFFEVLTPEGAVPGQTIHIVVPAASTVSPSETIVVPDVDPSTLGVFSQLRLLSDKAVAQAKQLDQQYQISHHVAEITAPAVQKLRSVDEKYQITEKTTAASSQAIAKIQQLDAKYEISTRANELLATTVQKVKEIDQSHQVSQRVTTAGEKLLAYAKEIDSKYAVSARAARLVQQGTTAIIAAYNRAVEIDQQNRYSERAAAAIAAGATAVVNKLSTARGGSTTSAPAEAEVETVPLAQVAVDDAAEARAL